eukprot:g5107.t1
MDDRRVPVVVDGSTSNTVGLMDENESPITMSTIRGCVAHTEPVKRNVSNYEYNKDEFESDEENADDDSDKITGFVHKPSTPIRAALRKSSARRQRGNKSRNEDIDTVKVENAANEILAEEVSENKQDSEVIVEREAKNASMGLLENEKGNMDDNCNCEIVVEKEHEAKNQVKHARTQETMSGNEKEVSDTVPTLSVSDAFLSKLSRNTGEDPVDVIVLKGGTFRISKTGPKRKGTNSTLSPPKPSQDEIDEAYKTWNLEKRKARAASRKKNAKILKKILAGEAKLRNKNGRVQLSDAILRKLIKNRSILSAASILEEAKWRVNEWLDSFIGRSELRKQHLDENGALKSAASSKDARCKLEKKRVEEERKCIESELGFQLDLLKEFQASPVAGGGDVFRHLVQRSLRVATSSEERRSTMGCEESQRA